jgi:hypothetical protein
MGRVGRNLGRATLLAIAALLIAMGTALPARAADSWATQSLVFQAGLGNDLPLRNAPWVGTHNSFNSIAEEGLALSPLDANQTLKLQPQLDLGMRSLELDLHTFPSVRRLLQNVPVVCHSQGKVGCTTERLFADILPEVGLWLRAHPGQIILLYLEDQLDATVAAHDAAAQVIEQNLGDLLWRPADDGAQCHPLPMELTRNQMLAAGKQVIIMGGCGQGAAWGRVAFDGSARLEDQPHGYQDYPVCDGRSRATYDAKLIRYYEDSTKLSALLGALGAAGVPGRITVDNAPFLARCGVDLLGLDQLKAGDPRLDALVWSWAPGQPTATGGDCTEQRVDAATPFGRWFVRDCEATLHVACRTSAGEWFVPTDVVTKASAAAIACEHRGGARATPRTGSEAQDLRVAMQAAGVSEAWIALRRVPGGFAAVDPR